jgi:hypothetical protein
MRASLTGRRAALAAAAASAALAACLGGCFGDTAILLQITGDLGQLNNPDQLTIQVMVTPPGGGLPVNAASSANLVALPLEIALAPSDALAEADVAITVTATAGGEVAGSGSATATFRPHQVIDLVLPLQPVGCVDDPLEPADLPPGGATVDPLTSPMLSGTLCRTDDADRVGVFVPNYYTARFVALGSDPPGVLSMTFTCQDATGAVAYTDGPYPLGPGTTFSYTPADGDKRCFATVERMVPDAVTANYAIAVRFGSDCLADDPNGGNTETVALSGFGTYPLAPRTGCEVGDFWELDNVPPGAVLRAALNPAVPDPSAFYWQISCSDANGTFTYHGGNGTALGRSGRADVGPATCNLTYFAPIDSMFDLTIEAADYATCVRDDGEDLEDTQGAIDLAAAAFTTPSFAVCRPAGTDSEEDTFVLDPTGFGATDVCVTLYTDFAFDQSLDAENTIDFRLDGSGNTVATSGSTVYGYGNPCVTSSDGQPLDSPIQMTVSCGYDPLGGPDSGCAAVYAVSWYSVSMTRGL